MNLVYKLAERLESLGFWKSRESPAYTATFKQDKGSHLLLLSLLRFKPHIKGDSETALTQSGCALSGVVKNSAKVLFCYWACCLRLSVGWI